MKLYSYISVNNKDILNFLKVIQSFVHALLTNFCKKIVLTKSSWPKRYAVACTAVIFAYLRVYYRKHKLL
jgi:hypothetical protein